MDMARFELTPDFDMGFFDDKCEKIKVEILHANDIDKQLDDIEIELEENETKLDFLTSHADITDYTVAAACGLITGLIDVFFTGEFSVKSGREWSSKKTDDFVLKVAKKIGYKGDDTKKAIKFMEKFGMVTDSVTSEFGGGLQHHLRDFSHHFSPIGLIFSLLTQFTEKAFGTDVNGAFKIVDITNKKFIGKNFLEKILFGTVYWFLHIVSDMAGSSGAKGDGTGVTGPFLSLAKGLSAFPIFKNKDGKNKLSEKISKLFNGTLLAEHNENGEIEVNKMDLRGEIGVAQQTLKQMLPVRINKILVCVFCFFKKMYLELKKEKSFDEINFTEIMNFKDRTFARMMTVSTAVFSATDLIDAAIRGMKNGGEFFARINYVGIVKLVLSISADTIMAIKEGETKKEIAKLKSVSLCLYNAKLFKGETLLWEAAKNADDAYESLQETIRTLAIQTTNDLNELQSSVCNINKIDTKEIENNNPGLLNDLLENL